MNPVAMTITNSWKEYRRAGGSNQEPSVLKSAMQPTELWGSAEQVVFAPVNVTLIFDFDIDR